ncbi:MAG TPA: hypothetical protein VH277_19735, partial [Gemmatimonadaceae bacterium]|nr:hypothetical protein [Gemmatimonadaceae bacterium]
MSLHRVLLSAAAGLLVTACTDSVPTSPELTAGTASADRLTPTFAFDTIDVPGAVTTTPQGINSAGDVVGFYTDTKKHTHGFVWHDGVAV